MPGIQSHKKAEFTSRWATTKKHTAKNKRKKIAEGINENIKLSNASIERRRKKKKKKKKNTVFASFQ
jgi:hypothetical protein